MPKSILITLIAIPALAWMVSCSAPDPGQGPLQVDFGKEVSQQYRDILFQAESLEIVALNPDWPTEETRQDPSTLHGYSVRGRAVLEERSLRLELLSALAQGTRENDDTAAACFNPRHAIIAESNGQVCEIIICFECLTLQIWDGTKSVEGAHLSETPRATFDRIYTDAGLSIAPRH